MGNSALILKKRRPGSNPYAFGTAYGCLYSSGANHLFSVALAGFRVKQLGTLSQRAL